MRFLINKSSYIIFLLVLACLFLTLKLDKQYTLLRIYDFQVKLEKHKNLSGKYPEDLKAVLAVENISNNYDYYDGCIHEQTITLKGHGYCYYHAYDEGGSYSLDIRSNFFYSFRYNSNSDELYPIGRLD